jgi:hypothetical protein
VPLLVPFVSPKTQKSKGKGQRQKTICVGLGSGFKLKDIVDVLLEATRSRYGACESYCYTFDFLDVTVRLSPPVT